MMTEGLAIEPFGKVFAVVEYGADGHKYGIYHCGSHADCRMWIEDEKARRAWLKKLATGREPSTPSSTTPS